MDVFLTIATILGLTALFSVINERFLGLQQTIGLVVIALVLVVVFGILNGLGIERGFVAIQAFVSELSLDATLLGGVLCFMLFAGSINVKSRVLGEEKWVILALALAATAAILVCLAARWISVFVPLNVLGVLGALKGNRVGLTNLLTWSGLRGGLAIAMALSLPSSPEKGLILHMTYGVVAFSIMVQGLTVSRMFKKEQLEHLLQPM